MSPQKRHGAWLLRNEKRRKDESDDVRTCHSRRTVSARWRRAARALEITSTLPRPVEIIRSPPFYFDIIQSRTLQTDASLLSIHLPPPRHATRRRQLIAQMPLLIARFLATICLCFVPTFAFHSPPTLTTLAHHVSRSSKKDSHLSPLQSASSSSDVLVDTATSSTRTPLGVAIVGAGPSGLLLAHRLLSSKNIDASVCIYEMRPDYRRSTLAAGSSRAYALGLGPRARSAIKSVDSDLWNEVSSRGFPCDRFTLHVTPKIKLRLRDGVKKLPRKYGGASIAKFEDQDTDDPGKLEPSVLIYQTDLCAALVDGLIKRHGNGEDGKLQLNFETRVAGADANDGFLSIQTEKFGADRTIGPFDLVAGCGGVNSPVRDAIAAAAPENTFTAETRTLPGEFKVARLPSMPPLLDPKSVALILPSNPKKDKNKKEGHGDKKGRANTMSAFVEPVAGGGACILFAGRSGGDADKESEHEHRKESLLSDWRLERFEQKDIDTFVEDTLARFPLLEGIPRKDVQSMVQQLLSQRPGVAAAVKCNAFHYGRAVLCGDAAHATGGVSGQGVNSALIDAAVLAELIDKQFANVEEGAETDAELSAALLKYSQRQVPEGIALYDLSFGPEGELGLLGRLRVLLSTVRDTIFGGKLGIGRPLLQVQLSSSTRSFADIRRERSDYYGGTKFPDSEEFNQMLEKLYDA